MEFWGAFWGGVFGFIAAVLFYYFSNWSGGRAKGRRLLRDLHFELRANAGYFEGMITQVNAASQISTNAGIVPPEIHDYLRSAISNRAFLAAISSDELELHERKDLFEALQQAYSAIPVFQSLEGAVYVESRQQARGPAKAYNSLRSAATFAAQSKLQCEELVGSVEAVIQELGGK